MSDQITTAFAQQYSSNVFDLVQQKGSRLRSAMLVETQTGKSAFYDQIGATEAQPRTSRHADTPITDTPHSRRMVTLVDYEVADLIDNQDRVRTLIDPSNPYAQSMAWALGRKMDDSIITAALGTAYTGEDGTATVAFPAGQKVAAATAGLTIAKLRSAREILNGNDVDPDEELYCAITSKQLSDLLAATEVTSSDFNTVKALVQGEVDTFLGFKFIRSERLTKDGNGDRQIICWAKTGMLLALGKDLSGKITERADTSYATQVYACMSIGATRLEEEKVVEVACVEA
jgi:hypothetical protein